jgi:hypothetical protein
MMGILMPFGAQAQPDTEVASHAVSLGVNGSALLAIETGQTIPLSLSGAPQAGAAIQTVAADSSARLRISSLVDGTARRTITASISTDPEGTDLYVTIKAPNTNFYGTERGTYGQHIHLTQTAATIITGIGTVWSGTEEDDGYVIKYSYELTPDASIFESEDVTVTYTLNEAS